jgi:hypothetical protein
LPFGGNISENAPFSKVYEENNPATAPFRHNHLIEMPGLPPEHEGFSFPPTIFDGATAGLSPKRLPATPLYRELGRNPLQFRRKGPHIFGTRHASRPGENNRIGFDV